MVYIGVASTDHGPVVCERATIAIGKSTFWFIFLSQDGIHLKFNLACDIGKWVSLERFCLISKEAVGARLKPRIREGSYGQFYPNTA